MTRRPSHRRRSSFVLTLDGWHAIMADLEIEFSRVLHVDQRFVVEPSAARR